MVCAWFATVPGFTRGSILASPDWARHSMRQNASALPSRAASMALFVMVAYCIVMVLGETTKSCRRERIQYRGGKKSNHHR
jgi:hypothetical protein